MAGALGLIFGYVISAGIQVLVTRAQVAHALGKPGAKQAGLAGFFGFVSSSFSFAALAASRSIFVKGAHPLNALAFLIASTNLVIELGIVLWLLVGWRFTLGNFALGAFMILYAWALAAVALPKGLAEEARKKAEASEQGEGHHHGMESGSWRDTLASYAGWQRIAAAFFTFIGSMGNVPLAAMLWSKGASFGGVMAFLGADLVAATVVWVHAKYYGWRYALLVSGLLYVAMVAAGITVHYLFAAFGQIPTERPQVGEMMRFAVDHTLFLNVGFLIVAGLLAWLHFGGAQSATQQSGRRG
jgi:uncharacterized membrane protein YraQ (UPF0718 family)